MARGPVRSRGVGVVVAAGVAVAAGLIGAAIVPAAHADSLPALPLPPFDLPAGFFTPPGTPGAPTNSEDFTVPLLYSSHEQDNSYTVTDGSYDTHLVEQIFGGVTGGGGGGNGFPALGITTEEVTTSVGAAPVVGAHWDYTGLTVPLFFGVPGAVSQVLEDSRLTTSAGTADVFMLFGLENDFYYGPAGIFDYIGFRGNDASFVPLIDLPAESAPASDFTELWPDLPATL